MTAATATLTAQTREQSGKGAARALRREGKVPAILYGTKGQPQALALSAKDVRLQYLKGRFQSKLVTLELDGKPVQALPREVQFHPVTDVIEHVDFQKVEKGVAIKVNVPVKAMNVEKSVGIKRGGVLNLVRHEIEFVCTPEAIPHHIEIDILNLDIGHSVHINDIKLPEGVAPVIKRNFTVATIAGRGKAEEEETTATAAATPAEGAAAAPAAGAAAAAPAADAKKDAGKK